MGVLPFMETSIFCILTLHAMPGKWRPTCPRGPRSASETSPSQSCCSTPVGEPRTDGRWDGGDRVTGKISVGKMDENQGKPWEIMEKSMWNYWNIYENICGKIYGKIVQHMWVWVGNWWEMRIHGGKVMDKKERRIMGVWLIDFQMGGAWSLERGS